MVSSETAHQWPAAVYVHVPFCRFRCGYCDFTLLANRDHLIPRYLTLLTREFERQFADLAAPHSVDTIFLGGGTPTHLSSDELTQLFELISRYFRLRPGGEYSVEANPDGLCQQKLNALQAAGVNRVSLGVQAFDDQVLKTLERQHAANEAAEAVERVAEVIPNTGVDLIFGVPGQTLTTWQATLRMAHSLPVTHISTYGLTYEQGTPFFRRERHGQLQRSPDELERDMYLTAIDDLNSQGFQHYEISNFARAGFACRHNETYWNADEYFAFGPGAARYVHGTRTTNMRSVVRWMNALDADRECTEDTETLCPEERAREAIMLGLRRIRGIERPAFEARFGFSLDSLAEDVLQRHLSQSLLEMDGPYLRLTRKGLLIADTVISEYL